VASSFAWSISVEAPISDCNWFEAAANYGRPYAIICLESLSFGLTAANERAVSNASVPSG